MTKAIRRIAITRKVSLEPYGDDLQDCYAIVTLATFREKAGLQENDDVKSMTNVQATEFMLKITESHFVSGKIRILADDGSSELVDMQKSDIAMSERVISDLYLTIMGVSLDPKAMSTLTDELPTANSSSEPSTEESSTKIISPSEPSQTTQA